ncbi:MAG: hypothetical protein ISR55_07165 [Bacteroidetes bacterium]|nr:hypothetical protein [Bacteroidota bacterium]
MKLLRILSIVLILAFVATITVKAIQISKEKTEITASLDEDKKADNDKKKSKDKKKSDCCEDGSKSKACCSDKKSSKDCSTKDKATASYSKCCSSKSTKK